MNVTQRGKIRFIYERQGVGVFLSHLDSLNALIRALRRSGLPYDVTAGMRPRPQVSFSPPLPFGHSSSCEIFDVTMKIEVAEEEAFSAFGKQLPKGFRLLKAMNLPIHAPPPPANQPIRYRLTVNFDATDLKNRVREFFTDPEKLISLQKSGEEKTFFLKPAIMSFSENVGPETVDFIIEFIQGKPEIPSVSKIFSQFLAEIGNGWNGLVEIERVAFIAPDEKNIKGGAIVSPNPCQH